MFGSAVIGDGKTFMLCLRRKRTVALHASSPSTSPYIKSICLTAISCQDPFTWMNVLRHPIRHRLIVGDLPIGEIGRGAGKSVAQKRIARNDSHVW